MFERFRIKTALRVEVVRLRDGGDPAALSRAEQVFFEPAFLVAPLMKQRRWTGEQAMVFMVTDVLLQARRQAVLRTYVVEDAGLYAALRAIHRHVLARAEADPALAGCVSRPAPGEPPPFDDDPAGG